MMYSVSTSIWKPDRKKICVSFSGGRSSAVMVKKIKELYGSTHEILVTFANTGCEHPATYNFVDDCDREWGLDVHWVEYRFANGKATAVRVSYETASRHGEPFEMVIKKFGIPNTVNPHCTRELKERTMERYRTSLGFTHGVKRNSCTAIGIRADEINRVNGKAESLGLFYPLIDLDMTKQGVNSYMSGFDFDLKLPSDAYGNCVWCWKKSDRKLMTLAKEFPDAFDFPESMENFYSTANTVGKDGSIRKACSPDGTRKFFRGHRTVKDIFNEAKTKKFELYADKTYNSGAYDPYLDNGNGSCAESCEVYT